MMVLGRLAHIGMIESVLLAGLALATFSCMAVHGLAVPGDEWLTPIKTIGFGSLNCVEACPAGDCFLSGSGNGLHLWNMQGQLISTLISGTPVFAEWSHDGTMIAAVLGNGSCMILSRGGKVLASTESIPSGVVNWLGDDPVVSSLDGSKLCIWGLRNATLLREIQLPGYMLGMYLSHDSGLVAAWSGQDSYLYMYSVWNGSLVQRFDARGNLLNAGWSPDDTKLAYSIYSTTRRSICIWDVRGRTKVAEQPVQYPANTVEWSRDGSLLGASSLDWIRIYDGTSLDPVMSLGPTQQQELLLSWFPDGSHLLSGSSGGPITIWDLSPTPRSLGPVQEQCGLTRVRYSSSGLLAVGLENGTIRCISGQDLERTEFSVGLTGAGAISALDWSRDSGWVATGYTGGMVATWSNAGGLMAGWTAHPGQVRDLCWHPTDGVLASVGDDGFLALWDEKGRVMRRENLTSRLSKRPMSLSFSPNGSMIAVGFAEGAARVLSYPDLVLLGSPLRTGHFTSLRWAPSTAQPGMDRLAGSGAPDGSILAWEAWGKIAYYEELKGHGREVTDLSWSPDGSILASCSLDGEVRLWQMVQRDLYGLKSMGGLLETLVTDAELTSVDWSPDGSVIASSRTGVLHSWNPRERQQVRMQNHTSQIRDVAWSPDSRKIAFNFGATDLGIYDVDSSELERRVLEVGPLGAILSVDWSGDGTRLAIGHARGIGIADAGGVLIVSIPQESAVMCVEWSPDSSYLASTAMDRSIRIWDGYAGNLLATLTGHAGYITAISWSSDGKWLASSDYQGWVRIWGMPSGEMVRQLKPAGDSVYWVSWSPDTRLLAVAGSDSLTGKMLLNVIDVEGKIVWGSEASGGIYRIAWSSTGSHIAATMSSDGDCIEIFTDTGISVCNLTPGSWGEVVEWSADGRFIASGGYDGVLKIYDAEFISQIPETMETVAYPAFVLFFLSTYRKRRHATEHGTQVSPSDAWPSARRRTQQSFE